MSSTRLSLDAEEVKARESRSRNDELDYFTVETSCLGCKKKVSAQVVELHGKLTCPRCQTIMHMGQDGKWHKGPPPTYIIRAPKFTKWQRLCYRFPLFRKRWFQAVAAVLMLCVIGIPVALLTFQPPLKLPENLGPRTGAVMGFVVSKDRGTFQRCLHSGTASEGMDFYEQLRSVIDQTEAEKSYETSLTGSKVIFQNSREGLAQSQITLQFKSPVGSPLGLDVMLFWSSDGTNWWIDGEKTLAAFTKQ